MDCPNVNETNKLFPDPPLGVYGGSNRTIIEIKENSVVIREDTSGFRWYQQYELRFEELTDVYFRASANWYYGYLSVRGRFNRWMPIPNNARSAMWDPMSVRFWTEQSHAFWKVYDFLRKCVEIARENPKVLTRPQTPPPIGVYKGVMGCLEMTEDSAILTKKMPGHPKTCCTMAYEDLYDVSLDKPTFWTNGELRVRCWQNRKIPIEHPFATETNLIFTKKQTAEFEKIYEFLKSCCRKTEE